jgi:hypothetical protein
VGLIQFSSVSFSFPYFAKEKTLYYGPPSQADWRIKETLDYISSRTKTSSLLIGILPNLPHFNTCTIALYAKFLKLPYFFYSLGGSNGPTIDRRENLDILIFTNPPFDNCVGREQEIYEEFNIKDASELGFKKIKEFDLPDNHRVIIYENLKKRNKEDR